MSSGIYKADLYRTSKVRNLRSIVLELYQTYYEDMVAKKGDDSMDLVMGRSLAPDLLAIANATAQLCPTEEICMNIQMSITRLSAVLKEFRKHGVFIEFLFGVLLDIFEGWEKHEEALVRSKHTSES